MCGLEMLMPLTFIQKADGSLEKTRDLWPQWAKDQWKMLEEILERIKEDADYSTVMLDGFTRLQAFREHEICDEPNAQNQGPRTQDS